MSQTNQAAATHSTQVYHKAKVWQIIAVSCNALLGMGVYTLIGFASYAASIGFGIATVVVGTILTLTRILDAITDPIVAFVYDRVNTRFGKIRILLIIGFAIEAVGLIGMFSVLAGKFTGAVGIVMFTILYVIYVIGKTLNDMTTQTINPLITNDPKQRPMLSVYTTIMNYVVPIVLNLLVYTKLMPKYGGYTLEFLSSVCWLVMGLGVVGTIITCIGVSEYDKPENFMGVTVKKERLSIKDMAQVLAHNHPLQCYIASAASDKIAQNVASQSIVNTMITGIIIGDMGVSSKLGALSMVFSVAFIFLGAMYARKFGNKNTIVTWTWASLGVSIIFFAFFAILFAQGKTTLVSTSAIFMVIYLVLTVLQKGTMMCITAGNSAFMADIIDYELDRGGKYVPAVVTGVSSLIDKFVSSFGTLIVTGSVALIGYKASMPQPTDVLTGPIFWMGMLLFFGLPVAGWIVTLVAMRFCKLGKAEVAEVEQRIADKKAAILNKESAEPLAEVAAEAEQ